MRVQKKTKKNNNKIQSSTEKCPFAAIISELLQHWH